MSTHVYRMHTGTCTCMYMYIDAVDQTHKCIHVHVHYSYMALIGMHELHGRMHPN